MSTPDCLIVGAGISGLLSALYLSRDGLRVTVLERGPVGRESSWAGGGILSPLYPWRYPEAVTRLAAWSQGQYPALCAGLAETTGIDPEWEPSGMLILDRDPRAGPWVSRHGVMVERVGGAALRAIEPALPVGVESAWWWPGLAQVRNPRLLKSLRAELERQGVALRERVEARGLELRAGQVRGVQVSAETLRAGRVLVTGGAWTAGLLGGVAPAVRVRPMKGQMLLYRTAPGTVRRMVLSGGRYLVPRRDGRVLVGSTLEDAGFDKAATPAARADLVRAALRLAPALRDWPIERHWAGLRPGSPDGVPYIGEVPGVRGLFVNAGHYRNGVVLAPASARLAADLITGSAPILDPSAYAVGLEREGDFGL